MEPNLSFFVPGFSKCGTTTLCQLLAEHPAIFLPEEKEPNFFAQSFSLGWSWYETFFQRARPDQLLGEGSTFYASMEFAEAAAARIAEHYPEARLIFLARHPLKRLESSYREMHHSGALYGVKAPPTIGEALRALPQMVADTRYWKILNIFRRRVPDDRILVLFLMDFQRQPAAELARCFAFLGVDPAVSVGNTQRRLNPGEAKLYDSPLMRWIRQHRWSDRLGRMIPEPLRCVLRRWLGLRRPFDRPIEWDAQSRAWLIEQIGDDARQFLAFCGKPADFWKFDG